MSSDQPLHHHGEIHLWDGTFPELAAEQISPADHTVLIVAETDSTAQTLSQEIEAALDTSIDNIHLLSDDQQQFPYADDSVDVTIHSNPSRNPFKYHKPLYQSTDVTKPGGTIVYRAPQRLAHSDVVELESIYAVGWEHHQDPSLAALMSVKSTSGIASTPGLENTALTQTTLP